MATEEDGYKNWDPAEIECKNCGGKFKEYVDSTVYGGCPHCGYFEVDSEADLFPNITEQILDIFQEDDVDNSFGKISVGILVILAVLLWLFA